jgi:hypothetical protein
MAEIAKKQRTPKTVDIPEDLFAWFKEYVNGFRYRVECLADCSMNNGTIDDVLVKGTCSPRTLDTLKSLKQRKEAA